MLIKTGIKVLVSSPLESLCMPDPWHPSAGCHWRLLHIEPRGLQMKATL